MRILLLILISLPIQAFAVWESVPPLRNTYSTSSILTVPYATPTDLCMIGNPTSGVITVHHIRISGYQTTGGVNGFYIVKRSTLSTGQRTALTAVGHGDYADSYADIQFFKASPSLGTTVGTLRGADILIPAPAGTSANGGYDFDFGPGSGVQPITLNKNEMVSVNFNSAAVPAGMSIICEFTWQEQ